MKSDFLSGLADRALGRAPVLQRRRPSLFEPSTGAGPFGGAPPQSSRLEDEQETTFEAESLRRERTAAGLTPTAPKPDPESVRPTSHAIGAERAQATGRRGASPPTTLLEGETRKLGHEGPSAPPSAGSQIKPTVREEAAAPSSSRVAPVPPSFAAASRRVVETIVEREMKRPDLREPSEQPPTESKREPVAAAPAPPHPAKPVVVRAVGAGSEGEKKFSPSPHQGTEARTLVEPRRTVRKEALQQIARPRVAPSGRPQPRPPNASPPAPTVQVTIGRIEVRAATPAAPARNARPAAPKLSLEDYLRARGAESK